METVRAMAAAVDQRAEGMLYAALAIRAGLDGSWSFYDMMPMFSLLAGVARLGSPNPASAQRLLQCANLVLPRSGRRNSPPAAISDMRRPDERLPTPYH
jgi:hypothetical protein